MKWTLCGLNGVQLLRRRITASVLTAVCATAAASAQPTNDTCNGATSILSVPYQQSLTLGNTAINNDFVSGGCANSFTGRGIWYTYTAPANGLATATFHLSVTAPDTLTTTNGGRYISIYSGACGSLTSAAPCVNTISNAGTSTRTFEVTAGTTYYLSVGSARVSSALPASATYNLVFDVLPYSPPPVNDDCAAAISLSSSPSSWTIDASGASGEDMTATCETEVNRGVWYKFASTINGRATFNFDSVGDGSVTTGKYISVFTGSCGSLTPVVNINGQPGATCAVEYSSTERARFTFDVSNGTTYYILAATDVQIIPPGKTFALSFDTITPPVNDTCGSATTISSLPYSATVEVGGATNSTLNVPTFAIVQPIEDIWYVYTPSADQVVRVDWSGPWQATNPNALLDYYKGGATGVYAGTCGNLRPIASSNGEPSPAPASVFTLRAGTTYYFMMGRRDRRSTSNPTWEIYPDDTFSFTITPVPVAAPGAIPNDNCATATPITLFPVTKTVSVLAGHDDVAGPACFSYDNGAPGLEIWTAGVWYTYTPPVNQFITAGPSGAENCDVIVYTGTCGSLTPVGCDARFAGRHLNAGTTYYIHVASFPTNHLFPRLIDREYSFFIDVTTAPSNDVCAAAKTVPSLPYTDSLNIGAATADSAGASCSGGSGSAGRGVWYAYTAPMSGPTITPMAVWVSHGATIRDALSIFDGGCGGSLVTCGDPGNAAFFEAEAGQTYAALIGDYGNNSYYLENGPFDRSVQFHPAIPSDNINCSTAYEITSFPFNMAADSSLGSIGTVPTGCNSFNQDAVYRAIYFTFTPAQSGTLTTDITRSYGGDITVLYSGACNNLMPISCTNNVGSSAGQSYRGYTQPTITTEVQAGVRYTLMVGINFNSESDVTGFNLFNMNITSACAADFNHVNGVTVQDIFDFLTAWLAGSPTANFNGVNGVTVQDIFDFLTAWLAGC